MGYYTAPYPFGGGKGGGFEPLTKFSKKGELGRISVFRGG